MGHTFRRRGIKRRKREGRREDGIERGVK